MDTLGDGSAAAPAIPWLVRTYAGHSSAQASNALYRSNLEHGQTGLSVAFDLPTQTGYDSDHVLARGEVGNVGVPIAHLCDMRDLFEGIPLERMNTSMTINATAPWLLALYVVAAEQQGAARVRLAGTVQNDILKEYLSRGTYVFPPRPSMRLTTDLIAFTVREMPKWNPINVCSYHLQEAGATPVQELSFALANACAVLDAVREGGDVSDALFPRVVGRLSWFVNAGMRFIEEMCKMRAFVDLWDEITQERYGVDDPKLRRFRYGVQVNSLGLTEQQPENNVYRILIEMLAVVLSKDARARAIQLPAWNEALGLPRPWDQQWSLRLQQVLALETDLTEYDDLFTGSPAIAAKVDSLKAEARGELARIEARGGALAAIEDGYMKEALVMSNARRVEAIETGEKVVVGVNAFTEGAPSPLDTAGEDRHLAVDAAAEADQVARLEAWRAARDDGAAGASLERLRADAAARRNIMPASIECARAGVTTGEWADVFRAAFGEYRAPTGVGAVPVSSGGNYGPARLDGLRAGAEALAARLGRRPRLLLAKPGLDGHSSGAEQIAVTARDAGFEVVYEGIRITPERLVQCAREEGVDVIGISVLSGSHLALAEDVMARLKAAGLKEIPVALGGIIPPADEAPLLRLGIARVYTPKDFKVAEIIADLLALAAKKAVTPV